MRMRWAFAGFAGLCGALLMQSCEPTVMIYEKPPEEIDLGQPCIIDNECGTGRCESGVCVVNECEDDDDCRDDEICNPITHTCEPLENFACDQGRVPVLVVDPDSIDFYTIVVGQSDSATVELHNIGDCLLTLEQALIDYNTSDTEFACLDCAAEDYPKRIPPGHFVQVDLVFVPTAEDEYAGQLQIRADDPSLINGIATVDLVGEGFGHPRMSIDPPLVDFGRVEINDPPDSRVVTVANIGAGELELSRVFVDPPTVTSRMTVTPAVGAVDDPIVLLAGETQDFTITFDPTELEASAATLYVFSNDETRTCAADTTDTPGVGCIELMGDSRGPPIIQVSHSSYDFGEMDLGESDALMVTISNNGHSDLGINVSMTAMSSTDFRYSPPSTSTIAPGATAFLNIFYEATQLNRVTGTMQILSNDPATPLHNISLTGTGRSAHLNDVLKLEMTFENGDDGFFGNDFRDVNLYVESPYGEVVDKANCDPTCPDWTHGGVDPTVDWGHPQWNAIGANEEPERVLLFDAHEDSYGEFKGCLYYREDCASIPSDLLAGLLGITVSALLTGITEGVIQPDAGDVSEFIQNNCFDHSSSRARIAVFINGEEIASKSATVNAKGDYKCPVTITRTAGKYCVEGAAVPQDGCP